MITKEHYIKKNCLFCASDYHLEMILLPYIKERINSTKFIIFTENDLEESINILLTKVNLADKDKQKIKNLNWKNTDDINFEKLGNITDKDLNLIVNGSLNYIELVNKKIRNLMSNNIEIIDCYHVGDSDIDISEISKKYNRVLNTQKI